MSNINCRKEVFTDCNIIKSSKRVICKCKYNNTDIIVKSNLDYEAKIEFNNALNAYKLFKGQEKFKVPKPMCYSDNEKFIALNYIKGKSKLWPLDKKSNNSKKSMTYNEYQLAIDFLVKLHHSYKHKNLNCSYLSDLSKSKYGGSSIDDKIKDDINKLDKLNIKDKRHFIKKIKYISKYAKKGATPNLLVLSHGDYKPDNFIFYKGKIAVIDWMDLGLRSPQYDIGSLLFLIKGEELVNLFSYYLKNMKLESEYNVKSFIKESIAIACVVHTNAPLSFNTAESNKELALSYIDYANEVLLSLSNRGILDFVHSLFNKIYYIIKSI